MRDDHIARPDARRHGAAPRRNVGSGDAFRACLPQHAVLEFVRRGAHGDIQRAKTEQHTHQGEETPASQRTPLRSMGLIFHGLPHLGAPFETANAIPLSDDT